MRPEEMRERVRGIVTIMVTPLTADLAIDKEGLRRNIEFLIANKVSAMVCGGSLGEFSSMFPEERRELIKTVVEMADGRLPVIAGTGCTGTMETVALSQYAEQVGADGLIIISPYYLIASQEGLYQHFRAVAESVGIGIMLYNSPARTGVNLVPKLVERLAEVGNIVALKEGARDLNQMSETIWRSRGRVAVLSGAEEIAVPCFSVGAVGTTSVSSGFMPQIFKRMYEAVQTNDWSTARRLHDSLQPYRNLVKEFGQPAVAKAAMPLVGLAGGPVRLPMLPFPESRKEELVAALRSAEAIS